MGKRTVVIVITVLLGLSQAAVAADVDELLNLEQFRQPVPAGEWPEAGTVFAYA
jgi:hypothetical protein